MVRGATLESKLRPDPTDDLGFLSHRPRERKPVGEDIVLAVADRPAAAYRRVVESQAAGSLVLDLPAAETGRAGRSGRVHRLSIEAEYPKEF